MPFVSVRFTQLTRDLVQRTLDAGQGGHDFAVLLEEQAKASGLTQAPEDVQLSDGL